MKNFLALFQQVGGVGILRQYLQSHVLIHASIQVILNGFSKKSLEIVRLSVTNKILRRLRKKYKGFISDFRSTYTPAEQVRSNKVWVCWLQGLEDAPPLVRKCVQSLQDHLPDREVILLTEENYSQYVQLPEFVMEKFQKGIMPVAHFSDLMRLELLLKHGGTWIDSTVFCSGGEIPPYMLDSDLFMFQALKPGLDGMPTCVSNWFITACTNHPMLALTQALLYEYWKKHNNLVDYFIFHHLFQLAIEAYPELWNQVIPFCNSAPHILLLRLSEPYNAEVWESIQKMTPFHKLSYKSDKYDPTQPGTYYYQLFGE